MMSGRRTFVRTPEEALARSYEEQYEKGDTSCALCGAPGEVLYHHLGGWWCHACQSIPATEWDKQSRRESLAETVNRFVRYHS
jgi:hypothetical protein